MAVALTQRIDGAVRVRAIRPADEDAVISDDRIREITGHAGYADAPLPRQGAGSQRVRPLIAIVTGVDLIRDDVIHAADGDTGRRRSASGERWAAVIDSDDLPRAGSQGRSREGRPPVAEGDRIKDATVHPVDEGHPPRRCSARRRDTSAETHPGVVGSPVCG